MYMLHKYTNYFNPNIVMKKVANHWGTERERGKAKQHDLYYLWALDLCSALTFSLKQFKLIMIAIPRLLIISNEVGALIRKLPIFYNKNKSISIDPNLLPIILRCRFCENCLHWWLLCFIVSALFMQQAVFSFQNIFIIWQWLFTGVPPYLSANKKYSFYWSHAN